MNKRFSFRVSQYLKKQRGIVSLLSLGLFLALGLAGFGKGVLPDNFWRVNAASPQGDSGASLWQEVAERSIPTYGTHSVAPKEYRTLYLNLGSLKQVLSAVPAERLDDSKDNGLSLALPMPDGSFSRFSIVESSIMAPELAKKFPEIKTYRGQGIDDPTATMRFSITPSGFQALILSSTKTVLVEPYTKNYTDYYLSYHLKDLPASEGVGCSVKEIKKNFSALVDSEITSLTTQNVSLGGTLRKYRLAVAATGEYSAANGGTASSVLAAITTIVNQVTAIYERELAIRFELIAREDRIIFFNSATDPYPTPTSDISQLWGPNQYALDHATDELGNPINLNYDIGQVFGVSNYGGAAEYATVCSSTAKAHGASTSNPASGTGFGLLVAHEIAHQFNATHTFNGSVGNCGSFGGGNQRISSSAYEPGSGSTIMSYAGSCSSQTGTPMPNTQNISYGRDAYFHSKSIEQINTYVAGGGSCASTTSTGNTAPVVEAGQNYTIPRATPFTLTAVGSDTIGDALTYSWEEADANLAVSPPDTDADGQARPIFRSRPPTSSASRTFPDMAYIRDNGNVPPTYLYSSPYTPVTGLLSGESLPMITRTMQFVVTARDNRSNGGGVTSDDMQVSVDGNSQPFFVTAPSMPSPGQPVIWEANTNQTVTWNVGNTTGSSINCSAVKITLSTDGGLTFPTTLSASTANDGSETISVPNITSTAARVKVEAIGNIFFDISDTDIVIKGTGCSYSLSGTGDTLGSGATVGYNTFTITTGCAWVAKSSVDWLTFKPGNGSGAVGGQIKYQVTANNDATRVGKIYVGGLVYTVTQTGSCSLQSITPTPSSGAFTYSGGSGSIAVTATTGTTACTWTSTSSVPWIVITSGTNGRGDSTVYFSVARNTLTISRMGTLTIGGLIYTINQSGASNVGPMTIGCYEPGNSNWYLRYTNAGGSPDIPPFSYGGSTYLPVVGDWDGDGVMTVGYYDPATGIWYLRNSNSMGAPAITVSFGATNYLPVAGDWDGNGTWTVGLYDPATGNWYLRNNFNNGAPGTYETPFSYGGGSQYKPVVGDWDGNGTTTIGCYEPGNGNWYLRNSNSAGSSETPFSYGGGTYIPVVGDWDGNGTTTIGCYEPTSGYWYLRNSNSGGASETSFQYGGSNFYKPVVGRWH